MYKLLIVDDEYQTRRGLCELIDWQSMHISLVGDASDGDNALQMVETHHPDILLTDVRMHRMDGLELARRSRELLPNLGIVFISGYSDADYLRNALYVGASDYIYKPIRTEELQSTMIRLVDKLNKQAEVLQLLENSKPILKERFLHSWFHGLLDDKQAIRSKLSLLGLSFPDNGDLLAIAFQPQWASLPENGQAENCQIVLEQLIHTNLNHVLTCAEDSGVITLLAVEDQHLDDALHRISHQAEVALHTPVNIAVSLKHEDWLDAHIAVEEAIQTIAGQTLETENRILFYEEETGSKQFTVNLMDNELLEGYLLSGNADMLIHFVESTLQESKHNAQLVRKLLMSAMLQMDLTLQRKGISVLDSAAFCRQAVSYQSITIIKNSFVSMIQEACKVIESRLEKSYSPAVDRAVQIIQTQYMDHLSVNMIAEQVHYSPAHLSTVFKRETGMTLSDSILQIRLKSAMNLLRTTLDSVSSIARQSGYADVQYFSRVFKQFTGLTPLEYRRKTLP